MTDRSLQQAIAQVQAVQSGQVQTPQVKAFFDEPTFTASYVVSDPATGKAAIIDSVMNFDPASGRTSFESADAIVAHVEAEALSIEWILETHAHADHLSAAPYLQEKLGGRLAIGRAITTVQDAFGKIFNEGTEFARDGSQFDRLLDDGDVLAIGEIPLIALYVPGHTPADMAYVVGDALFAGDTVFMPDYGSARTDFPGGDARQLYRSIHKLLALPPETRLFMCHDYKAPGRAEYAWETTVAEERAHNVHVGGGISEDDYVAMREARDAKLSIPRLLLPAIQVNIRAGRFPPAEANGVCYLRIPVKIAGANPNRRTANESATCMG
jgi:glyoxylase-like metal-dependent hydrolase (beta-lactamase superfamily II)